MSAQVVILEDGKIRTTANLLERLAAVEAKLAAVRSIAEQPVTGPRRFRIDALEQKFQDIADALA